MLQMNMSKDTTVVSRDFARQLKHSFCYGRKHEMIAYNDMIGWYNQKKKGWHNLETKEFRPITIKEMRLFTFLNAADI